MSQTIISRLGWINLFITVTFAITVFLNLVLSSDISGQNNPTLDIIIFSLTWFYIILTPILSGLFFITRKDKNTITKINIVLLFIWIVFVLWTTTITF